MVDILDFDSNLVKVPCGKCAFCLTNKRSQWMFRIWHEMKNQSYKGWFLTFTYDEKHVKRTVDGKLSLRFRDVQLFLKQVRKRKYYVKYIIVGEYGGQTKRPHYHGLIWTDCSPEELEKIWDRGRIHIGQLTMASAMYTLKYIIQPKQKVDGDLERTRAQFSKGLGLSYLSTPVYNWHTADYENPIMHSYIDGKKLPLPRYYRSKIFTKYQQKKLGDEQKARSLKEYRKKEKEWFKLGLRTYSQVRARILSVRIDQAAQIVKSVKHNLSL